MVKNKTGTEAGKKIFFICLALSLLSACGGIYSKGGGWGKEIKIKVETVKGSAGNSMDNDGTVSNAKELTRERLEAILSSSFYEKRSLIFKNEPERVFSSLVVAQLAPPLLKAMASSRINQRVRFSIKNRGKGTSGYCFVRKKGICLLLEEIEGVPFITSDSFKAKEIDFNRGNDDMESSRAWKLSPEKGQRNYRWMDIFGISRKLENVLWSPIESSR